MQNQQNQISLFDWEPSASHVRVDALVMFPGIVLSLFEQSGYASLYWRMAGYQVISVDTKLGIDIMNWNYKALDKSRVIGIMAFPPCTHFTNSGAQYWKEKDEDGRTAENVKLVKKAMEIINYFEPDWWFLENPVGRIAKLVPELKNYGPFYFYPYEYGDPWKKKTALYGKFKPPVKKPVKPIQKVAGNGDKYSPIMMATGGKSEKTKMIRSVTPKGFAKAFYLANAKEFIEVYYYECECGYEFEEELGKYGCPNCCGEFTAELKTRYRET